MAIRSFLNITKMKKLIILLFTFISLNVIGQTFTATATQTDISCYGGNDGTITVNVSGGFAPYIYITESTNSVFTSIIYGKNDSLKIEAYNHVTSYASIALNSQTFKAYTGLFTGEYLTTVTDYNGSVATVTVELTYNAGVFLILKSINKIPVTSINKIQSVLKSGVYKINGILTSNP